LIQLQLNAVRVKPPINRMAEAFEPTFGRLYGPFDASGATDHDTLLQAPELMTIGAQQIFEKANPIAHRFRLSNLRMPAPPPFVLELDQSGFVHFGLRSFQVLISSTKTTSGDKSRANVYVEVRPKGRLNRRKAAYVGVSRANST
jgi:hypothetical protein